jgi:hypothetical protein
MDTTSLHCFRLAKVATFHDPPCLYSTVVSLDRRGQARQDSFRPYVIHIINPPRAQGPGPPFSIQARLFSLFVSKPPPRAKACNLETSLLPSQRPKDSIIHQPSSWFRAPSPKLGHLSLPVTRPLGNATTLINCLNIPFLLPSNEIYPTRSTSRRLHIPNLELDAQSLSVA